MLADAGRVEAFSGRLPRARRERMVTALAVLALAGVGCWFRVAGAHEVVLPAGAAPRLLGTDAYDHLRRAAELAGTLPGELAPRPVGDGDWVEPGLFDALLAAPARLIGSSPPTLEQLMAGAAWVPPALAVLSIVTLFALAARFLPPFDAWCTALLFVLYPGESLDRTTLGFADHHAAEIALTLLALWALVRELQSARDRPWWRPAFLAAAPAAALALVWRGAPLTLVLMALGLLVVALLTLATGRQVERLGRQALRYALGLATLLALVALLAPELQLGPVTTLRVWLAVAALAATSGLTFGLAAARRSRLAARGPWLVVAALVLVLGAVFASGRGQRLTAPLSTPRTATVQEHTLVAWSNVLPTLGAVALCALPGFVVGLGAVLRRRLDPALALPLVMALGWSLIWWRIHDVGYLPPSLLALAAGCLLWGARRFLLAGAERRAAPRTLRLARLLSAAPAVVLALAPIWPYRLAVVPATSAARAEALVAYRPAAFEAASWLRDHTPAGGDHAVVSPWVLGNLIATAGQRRPLWSRMPTPAAGAWLVAPSEESSLEILAAASGGDPVRFAVIDARSCGGHFVAEARNAGVEPEAEPAGRLQAGAGELRLWRFGASYSASLAARLCFGATGDQSLYRLRWESSDRMVTAYQMRFLPGAPVDSLQLRLETRPLGAGETPPPATAVSWSADGSSVRYLPRTHAEFRIFEIVGGEAGGVEIGGAPEVPG